VEAKARPAAATALIALRQKVVDTSRTARGSACRLRIRETAIGGRSSSSSGVVEWRRSARVPVREDADQQRHEPEFFVKRASTGSGAFVWEHSEGTQILHRAFWRSSSRG